MTPYPKIETLYERDNKTFKVKTDSLRLEEFGLVKRWHITEKIHGTNIRVMFDSDYVVRFGGRTDNSQIPTFLLNKLQDLFPANRFQEAFVPVEGVWPSVVLYGEGYGEKIQKGGGNYRCGVSFRLFDVRVGDWWLNWENVEDVAEKMGIRTVPHLADIDSLPRSATDIAYLFASPTRFESPSRFGSWVASEERDLTGTQPEGIVARTDPLLFTRRGSRVMWKLKFKDF